MINLYPIKKGYKFVTLIILPTFYLIVTREQIITNKNK